MTVELMSTGLFSSQKSGVNGDFEALVPDASFTSTTGKGRVIDFALVNRQAKALVSELAVESTAPWKTHESLRFEVRRSAK